jgi:hypothetical protein
VGLGGGGIVGMADAWAKESFIINTKFISY